MNILDATLFHWGVKEPCTVRDSAEGFLVTGGIGSGKTSGAGNLLANAFLRNGLGGIVLTAKSGTELNLWKKYCRDNNREDDLVIIGPNSDQAFNFLDYESNLRSDNAKGIAHNIADVLKTVIKSDEQSGHESDKAFWDSTLQQLLVNAIDLCLLTQETLKLEDIYKVVQSAPKTQKQRDDKDWCLSSQCMGLMSYAGKQLNKQSKTDHTDRLASRLFKIEEFFLDSWLNLSEKTRSIVNTMFFGFTDRFLREPLYSLFCKGTTLTPEDTIEGKIILIDLPYLTYERTGRDAQVMFKYIFQRAMQRRVIKPESMPTFLWSDEAHYFLHSHDVKFQSTIRDFRCATVYITQNLPNFYLHAGGGDMGKTRFRALAGNLSTKFFHANSDVETNEYSADLIGKYWGHVGNQGRSTGEKTSFSQGSSESLKYKVEPSEFTTLKTGSRTNNFIVQAIVHRQGRLFRNTQDNYSLIHLKQNIS